jgi:arsenate reductase (glutaredoxin)
VSFLDVAQRPPAAAELRRFVERFTAAGLLDTESRAYRDSGLAYLRMSDAEVAERISADARLLRLPLVRSGTRLSVGSDQAAWSEMAEAERPT